MNKICSLLKMQQYVFYILCIFEKFPRGRSANFLRNQATDKNVLHTNATATKCSFQRYAAQLCVFSRFDTIVENVSAFFNRQSLLKV